MTDPEYLELEERLRSLPTSAPPAALRERVLAAASARRRVNWRARLACALCVLGLVILDLAVDRVQSARLAGLVGGQEMVSASSSDSSLALAFQQRKQMLLAYLAGNDKEL